MKKNVLLGWIIFGMISLYGAGDLHLFSAPNSDGKLSAKEIEKALEANGFYISANSEMTEPFMKQFQ